METRFLKAAATCGLWLTLLAGGAAALAATPANSQTLPIIPRPADVAQQPGELVLGAAAVRDLEVVCSDVGAALAQATNQAGAIDTALLESRLTRVPVRVQLSPNQPNLQDESYTLDVSPSGAALTAPAPAGILYGLETLCQLLPLPDPATSGAGSTRALPFVKITDRPRFAWRGMHLDVSRHFFTKAEVLRYLDLLARFKFNVFHWHLTDDGGWRIEIKRFPKLTSVGAWRRSMSDTWNPEKLDFPGPDTGEALYGGFYSQDDIREVVAYAAARHITVVPEIEMPGHCVPALVAYPELKCGGLTPVPGRAYDSRAMCPGKDTTFAFLEGVLEEVLELFPSRYIHIGGDEVDRAIWTRCPHCRKRIQKESLADEAQLQSYMIRRVERFLSARGRTLIGWDEILDGGLAPNAVVMSWRGMAGGVAAARAGHQVVMSPTSHCYFDQPYANVSTDTVYGFEPVPAELNEAQARLVLGGQGNVWTEWIPDFARVQLMVLPRMLALAEVLWSPRGATFADFEARLGPFYGRFDARGESYYFAPPRSEVAVVSFTDRVSIELPAAKAPGLALRYTTDGSSPSPDSKIYSGPITVDTDVTVRAAWFGKRGQLGGAGVVRAVRTSALVPPGLSPGLAYETFVRLFERMPAFDAIPADGRGVQAAPDIGPIDPAVPFAVQWRGWLRVDQPGTYTFTLGSDDGGVLWLYDAPVVDNDGQHAYLERSGAARLGSGYHPLRIGYYNALGARDFKVWIEGPGLPRQPLSGTLIWHEER